jgi:hypothetical protein
LKDWVSRYKSGEHLDVWAEMRGFGARLPRGRRLEAAEVAKLTLLRALANLVRIELELRRLGYEFLSACAPPTGDMLDAVGASGVEALSSLPGLGPAELEKMMQLMRGQVGSMADRLPRAAEPNFTVRSSALGNPGAHLQCLDDYMMHVTPAPMALAEFWRQVGWVDFTGRESPRAPARLEWQPLVVNPPFGLLDDFEQFLDDNGDCGFAFDLMPDPRRDDGFGPSEMIQADMQFGADARLNTGEWFVDHLRRMTRRACFAADGDAAAAFGRDFDRIRRDWSPF